MKNKSIDEITANNGKTFAQMRAEIDEACWDSHKQVGTKMKGGKRVPNCVPKNEANDPQSADKGKKVRSSKSWIRDGSTRSKGLRDWVKQDWRQVANPDKKCGE